MRENNLLSPDSLEGNWFAHPTENIPIKLADCFGIEKTRDFLRQQILDSAASQTEKSALLAILRAFNAQRHPKTIHKYFSWVPLSPNLLAYLETFSPDYQTIIKDNWTAAQNKNSTTE